MWRIGPVVGVGGRLFSFGRDDIYALREFGLVDDGETKFNKNFKRLDFNVGAQCTFQPLAKYFIQANLNYGLLPQIILPKIPQIYQANVQLSVGFLLD